MFDIAWTEMALVAAVALIVIGPKELPAVLRQLGRWMRKLRLLAGEFQRNLDDMVRDAELDDVKRQVERIGSTNLAREVERTIDPTGEVERSLRIDDGPDLAKINTADTMPPAPPAAPEAGPPQAKPDGSTP